MPTFHHGGGNLPYVTYTAAELKNGIPWPQVLVDIAAAQSKSEARRLIAQNAVYLVPLLGTRTLVRDVDDRLIAGRIPPKDGLIVRVGRMRWRRIFLDRD